jgi:hypothetical protein
MNESTAESSVQDPTEITLDECWDSAVITGLVRRNTFRGHMPAFLMLGKREATMLRNHLANAFGDEEIAKLNELHYAGLKVIETRLESLVKVAGEKMSPDLERAARHQPSIRQLTEACRWRFDAGLA